MRANIPDYELKSLKSFDEALKLLTNEPGIWRPFAGGTDLMVLFEAGKLTHKKFFSLLNFEELQGIETSPTHVTLGALTTYSQVQGNALLNAEFPMLGKAASETGAIAIQNRGTLGGNIANASPAADSPPALLVYDTELELVSTRGARWVPYSGFHTGYKRMDLKSDEILRRIRITRNTKGAFQFYRKVGARRAQAISKVCFAGLLRAKGDHVEEVKVSLGSVGPTVLRCLKAEKLVTGQTITPQLLARVRDELAREITPIDDIRSTRSYRVRVAQNLMEEFLACGTGFQN